jgi:hypothetical protein
MTPAERLQPAVTAVYNAMNSNVPAVPPYNNIKQFLDGDPDLLVYAKAEIKRLTDPGLRGKLFETDYESKIRHQALERIVTLYDEGGP